MIRFAMLYRVICEYQNEDTIATMRIFITGANGFIGKNLKELWSGKYDVCCPSSRELNLLNAELVWDYIQKGGFDIVIHAANTNLKRHNTLAGQSDLNDNLQMFFNLERCKDYYGKMYYLGSGAEYDMQHYIPCMKEEYFGTYIPKDSYGFSKYVMSRMCEQDNNIYDLRLFGVFGKYEEWERRFISNAICRVLKGMPITINQNVYFDYLWVEDLCNIMEWFITNDPKYKHYNVCRGSKIDLYSLACMVRDILSVDCEIIVKESGWKPEYTGNNTRLMSEMGTYQFLGFEEAISRLCDYYKANLHVIDADKLL